MKTTLRKGAVLLTISSVIFMASGYLINVILGRTLGPRDYGVYGIITSIISFINIMQTSGLTQAVSKFVAEDSEDADAILTRGLALQAVFIVFFFLIFYLYAKSIALFLHDQALIPYIKLAAFSFPIYGVYSLYSDFYNGRHFFQKQATMNIVYSIAKAVGVLLLAVFFHLTGVFWGFIIAPLFALLVGFYIPKPKKSSFKIKTLLYFSLSLVSFSILSNLLLSLDIFLIKVLLKSAEAPGYYTASQNIARIPYYAMSSLFLVVFPAISHSVKNKPMQDTQKLIKQVIRFICLLTFPGVLILSATSRSILTFLYSNTYIPASTSFSILVIGMGFFTLFSVFTFILSGAGLPKMSLFSSLIGVITTLVMGIFLIPKLTITGAAIATASGCFISMIISSIFLYQQFKTMIDGKDIIKIVSASLPVYILSLLIHYPPILLPVIYCLLFGCYILLLILFKETNIYEIKNTFIPHID